MKKVIFDCSIFIYAHHHINIAQGLSITPLQLAEKALTQIERIAFKNYGDRQIILSLDSDTCFRKDIYADYKGNRKSSPFDKDVVWDYFKNSMHEHIQVEGLESDDLMFLMSRKYPGSVLVTNDKDFLLMLDPYTKVYYYRKDEEVVMNAEQILEEQLLKACGGCKSDEIPAIKLKKFGPVTLRKMILAGTLRTINQSLKALKEANYIEDFKRNYELVVYRVETYLKYVKDFEKIYNSL